jgi:hypothetical protein
MPPYYAKVANVQLGKTLFPEGTKSNRKYRNILELTIVAILLSCTRIKTNGDLAPTCGKPRSSMTA